MKGILFKPEMIRAILDGKKTMTRRIIKPQPEHDFRFIAPAIVNYKFALKDNMKYIIAPYQPGEVIYIKEAYDEGCMGGYIYKLDYTDEELKSAAKGVFRWKSPLFMPKKAARFYLQIKNVNIQRLSEISVEDALKEGFTNTFNFLAYWCKINGEQSLDENPWVWVITFTPIPF